MAEKEISCNGISSSSRSVSPIFVVCCLVAVVKSVRQTKHDPVIDIITVLYVVAGG